MKKLIVAFSLLLFAIWLGFLIHRDPGYILITYQTWSIETSLWIGIVIVLIIFVIFYFLLRFFRHTSRLSINLKIWNKERREHKAGELTNQAFNTLIEMEWRQAENLFSKSAKNSVSPVINYSAAAYAAHRQSAYDRRNQYLTKLSNQVKTASKTAKLIESYFYIQTKQWQEASTLLRMLQKQHPQDRVIIYFLATALEGAEAWESLKKLAPSIERQAHHLEYQKLISKIYCGLLKQAIHPEWLDQVWEEIPKSQRTKARIAITYAKKARELRRDNEAVNVVETALKKNWDSELITEYGKLKSKYANKQIDRAETWLKKHPNDPNLLLCLGQLCTQAKLWGKAQDYLDKALGIAATTEVYYELGRLLEMTDNPQGALRYYRKALALYFT